MQLTPNYNLKKPEGTDPVDIQDFNDNADVVDAALKKKAESSGGDISEMTVKTLDNITTDFPVPVAGEKPKTFLGKVKKFFEDTKNWMTGVCLIGSIVNNCVTDNAKLPLSAAQGKALMDLYTVLNTNLTNLKNKNPSTYMVVEQVSKVYSGLIAVFQGVNVSFTIPTKSGYTAKLIFLGGNNSKMYLVSHEPCKLISGTSVSFGIYNAGSTDGGNVSNVTFYAIIMYIKNTV